MYDMESLVIVNNSAIKIRKGLGIFTFLIAILWVFIFLDSRKIFDLLQFGLWAFIGASHFTQGFGLEKSFIEIGNTGLIIKWMNKIKPVIVSDSEIENISLKKSEIIINRVNKKPIRLKRSYLELKQMTEVYKFFIEYSKDKNITLIRQS
jgi:hypothetical protein